MSQLKELLTSRKGKSRICFKSEDLGWPAAPPWIKAGCDAVNLPVFPDGEFARFAEGYPELSARIILKLTDVAKALELLAALPASESGKLQLINRDCRPPMELAFPVCRLLPEWEFEPSFTENHLITIKFSAIPDENGKLFYFSGLSAAE